MPNLITRGYGIFGKITCTADGYDQTFEKTITSAQLLALRATPIALIALPGAGKIWEFVSATIICDAGTAYVVGTNDLAIRYGTAADIISQTIDTAGLIDDTTDRMALVLPVTADNKTTKTDCHNVALYLHNTGASELTTGTGVLRVKITVRRWTTGW